MEQSGHLHQASSATQETSFCTDPSKKSGLLSPFPLSHTPPYPLPHLKPVNILSGPVFLGSSFHSGLSLSSPESEAEVVDLFVSRDYNPRKQEWRTREVRPKRKKSHYKDVAWSWLWWNKNDCLMLGALPWAAVQTASRNCPSEDRKDTTGPPPDALYWACSPISQVLCWLISALCSAMLPESHRNSKLCPQSPQPLADWQAVQRTGPLPQFMFQSAPWVPTEVSHLLRSNLCLVSSPALIWFPHSLSPESVPFINHLLELLIIVTFCPLFVEDIVLLFDFNPAISRCSYESWHNIASVVGYIIVHSYLVPPPPAGDTPWGRIIGPCSVELRHRHMAWFGQESVKRSDACHFWGEALIAKSRFTILFFPPIKRPIIFQLEVVWHGSQCNGAELFLIWDGHVV